MYNIILKNPRASRALRTQASQNLALVRAKQRQYAPRMKRLLRQAIADYHAGRYTQASNALYTISITGANLGWKNNGRVAEYQRKIALRRLAAVQRMRHSRTARENGRTAVVAMAPNRSHVLPRPVNREPTHRRPRPVEMHPMPPAHRPTRVAEGTLPGSTGRPGRTIHPGTRTIITHAPPAPRISPRNTEQHVMPPTMPNERGHFTGTGIARVRPHVPHSVLIDARRARASRLVERADNEMQAARYQDAIKLYQEALRLNPNNGAARTGLNYTKKIAGGGHVNLLGQMRYRVAIARERAKVLYNNDMVRSTSALRAAHYNTAVIRANDAIANLNGNRRYFPTTEYRTLLVAARREAATAQADQAQAERMAQNIARKKAAENNLALSRRLSMQRHRRIHILMKQAVAFAQRQQYRQAEDVLKQVINIEPTNNFAKYMLMMTREHIQFRQYHDYRQTRIAETQHQKVVDEEALIPYHDLLIYPEDWPEISRMRRAEQTNTQSVADRKTRQRLAQAIPNVSVRSRPFQAVVKFLRTTTNTNIVVNWNALEGAGVEKSTPVTLHLSDVAFKTVLRTVLNQAGASASLGYSISHGVIYISTEDQLSKQTVVRVYDIQDLLVQPPYFGSFPSFNLQSATSSGQTQINGGSGGLGGGGAQQQGSLFQTSGNNAGGAKPKSRRRMVREITKLIENTVARNSWVNNGGTVGSMRELNGQLVVNQTPDTQVKVYNLLQQLREAAALEISIQARFLLVENNFLNDFGFSWGVTVPAGVLGPNAGAFTAQNNTAEIAVPAATGIPGSLAGSVGGGKTTTGTTAAAGTTTTTTAAIDSLDLTGSILSNYQVSMLLRATQADKETTTLTAPRVTLYNGQAGYIVVADQLNFVSNVGQNVAAGGFNGNGVVGTNLTISTLTTGVILAVQATASADRRYVVMTLQPSLSSLNGIQTFNIGNAFVQLPNVSLTQVKTTVSIPDGGTLLIGGQKLVGESEIEAGVPVLSKIPFINRLFTNTSYVKDERTLLILVRPRIIIQKEAEFKQFGRNY